MRLSGVVAVALAGLLAGAGQAQQPLGPAMPGAVFDPLTGRPVAPRAAGEGDPELGGLPAGDGAELTFAICSGCHSVTMVSHQRLTRERWDYLLDWMVAQQGMPELPAEERATILDYLATHLGPAG